MEELQRAGSCWQGWTVAERSPLCREQAGQQLRPERGKSTHRRFEHMQPEAPTQTLAPTLPSPTHSPASLQWPLLPAAVALDVDF